MIKKGVWHKVSEKTRVYNFPDATGLLINNVIGLLVTETGNHYVRTSGGKQYIVSPNWDWLSFEADDFTIS